MNDFVFLGFSVAVVVGMMILWRAWENAKRDRARRPRY